MVLFTTLILLLSPLKSFAQSGTCGSPELFHAFDQLSRVDRLHNCSIEFVRLDSDDEVVFLGYARDLTPTSDSASPELTFSFRFEKECADSMIEYQNRSLKKSYGYTSSISDFRVAIRLDFMNSLLPNRMLIQKIDLLDHEVVERINCGRVRGL